MFDAGETPIDWKRLARDLGIAILLVVVTIELFGQARSHEPSFRESDIQVVEAPIAGFTTVRVWEHGPPPPRAPTIRSRSALLLEDYPPNLDWYVPGWSFPMEDRFAIGDTIRLEVAEDPAAQAAQARAWPEAEYQLAIVGMQYGDEVFFQASDSIARAEGSVRTYRRLGMLATLFTLLWLGWVVWSWWSGLQTIVDTLRG